MEEASKRTYDQLDLDEKVRAILGNVFAAIPKEQILKFSGIVYDSLSKDQQEKIDAVFVSEDVVATDTDEGKIYRLSESAIQEMGNSIDMESVHRRLADQMLADLKEAGFDLDDIDYED